MPDTARYDAAIDWYEEFRPALSEPEEAALRRLLGAGRGRCLDAGCGTGVALPVLRDLGWTAIGIDESEVALARARERGGDVLSGDLRHLPFEDESFDAAISVWTHTDVDDFDAAVRELARVVQPGAPLVYLGAHPCFIGPHSRFFYAKGVPTLYPGYRETGRYEVGAAGINPDGLRARVGAVHLPLAHFMQAFLGAALELEVFEEWPEREYPHMLAVRWRRRRA
jgi:SAM-dependent methyltransferase